MTRNNGLQSHDTEPIPIEVTALLLALHTHIRFIATRDQDGPVPRADRTMALLAADYQLLSVNRDNHQKGEPHTNDHP